MKLSVLIPTTGSFETINLSLDVIIPSLRKSNIKFEIVVSSYKEIPTFHIFPDEVKTYKQEVAFLSAEEHLFNALKLCKGDYIWVLSDNDLPISDGVLKLATYLKMSATDVVMFNSIHRDSDGNKRRSLTVPVNSKKLSYSYSEIVAVTGYWWGAALFSSTIFKRNLIDTKRALISISEIGGIYAHVSEYLRAFQGKSASFVNFPLVVYTENDYKLDKNWEILARKRNKRIYDPWTIEFISQLNLLFDERILDKSFLRTALDRSSGIVRLLSNHIEDLVLREIEQGSRWTQVYSSREIELLVRFFLTIWPEDTIRYTKFYNLLAAKHIRSRKLTVDSYRSIYIHSNETGFERLWMRRMAGEDYFEGPINDFVIPEGSNPYFHYFFADQTSDSFSSQKSGAPLELSPEEVNRIRFLLSRLRRFWIYIPHFIKTKF